MRISEAKTTSKGVLTLSDIKGVDLSSSPVRVKSTRASYMKNMICKGGVNHKRNGFEEIASFYGEDGESLAINGIFPYISEGEDYKIVHAGASLYKCSSDFSIKELISLDGVELGSEKSQGYLSKDELYIIAGERLLVYDGEKVGALFDRENAYVPTTSIGILDEVGGSLTQPYEGVNLFSSKRINKLTGKRRGTTKASSTDATQNVFTLEESKSTFFLDGEIDFEKDVVITADVFIDGGLNKYSENETALPVVAYYSNELYAKSNINVSTIFAFPAGTVSVKGSSSFMNGAQKVEIDGFAEPSGYEGAFTGDFECEIANVDGRGVVTFTPALPSPVLGEDNITVEYYTKKEAPKIKAACECSVNTYSKMLVIATEDDVVYYSSPSEGYSYFPDNNYLKAVNNVSSLIAGGDFLGVASKDELAVVTFSIDSSGEKIVCVPSLVKKHRDIGCSYGYSQAYLEGDTLFLSSKGVFGASQSDVHMRSGNINKELTSYASESFEDACALEHDGRYYLFIDGQVYIADARYKTYESDRLDVSYEYEWWRWENCPCRVAINFNGRLLLGREDGRIMATHEGYSDITYYKLNSSEVLTDGNSFVFNEELGVCESDRVKIEGAYRYLSGGTFEYLPENKARIIFENDELLRVLQKNILREGQAVRIYIKAQRITADVVIEALNLEEASISFSYTPNDYELQSSSGTAIYGLCEGELFTPMKNEETTAELWDYILLDDFGEQAYFMDFDNIKATIIYKKTVECEIHTSLFNLATDMKKKTIHKIAFIPGASASGKIQIGYETDKRSKLVGQVAGAELDFSSLDFDNFTFDSAFLRCFEKRVLERNVQFIRFKLLSLEDADFSIESLSVVYSTNSR